MYLVDRLNRQYEKLKEAVEEPENMGPLEASVKNLQKEVAAVRKKFHSAQRIANRLNSIAVLMFSYVGSNKNYSGMLLTKMPKALERGGDLLCC